MANVEQILRERDSLLEQRGPHEADWQTIAELMLPAKSDINTKRHPGDRRTQRLLDSTAMFALDTFANHLMASAMNFQQQFFLLRMRALRQSQAANAWFDEVSRLMLEDFTSNESLVPSATFEAIKQYCGLATGALYIDERPLLEKPAPGFRGYLAQALPIGTYTCAENSVGVVDTVFRDFELSPRKAAQWFGIEALSKDMQDLLRDSSSTQKTYIPQAFVQAVRPRRTETGATDGWESVYVEVKEKHEVSVSQYPWNPCIVFRYEKLLVPSPWGFGRGHLALPESLTLQVIDKDVLRSLPMHIFPPGFLAGGDEDSVGRVSLLPASINPIAKGAQWQPYSVGRAFSIADLGIADRQRRVERAFFLDHLQFLPPPEQRTQRTLGELEMRARLFSRLMGPAFTRFLGELLNPFMDVTFALKLHAGDLPFPPDEVLMAAQAAQGKIDVEYEGPLARAQHEEEAASIQDALQLGAALARELGDPHLLQNLDVDDAYARWLEVRGFPKAFLRDRAFMKALRKQVMEQQAQQQQAQGVREDASALGAAAPMVKTLTEVAG